MSELFNAPNRQVTKIPMDMLRDLQQGYYAVRQDDNRPWTFIRCSWPKTRRLNGWQIIQTQHGDELKPALSIDPTGRLHWYNMSIETELLIICVDPNTCAISYGEQIGRCCRCNKELTDERSRWYSIGPECETKWPQIVDMVAEKKGIYVESSPS